MGLDECRLLHKEDELKALSSSLDWVVKECLKIFPNLIKRKLVCVLHGTKILFFALWMMARSIRVFGKMKQMVSNRNFLCG